MTERRKIYFTFLTTIVIVAIILFLIVPLLIGQIRYAGLALAQKKQALINLQEKQKNVAELKKNYEKIKPDLDKIGQSIISQEKILDFIVALEETAKKSNNRYEIKVLEKSEEKTSQKDFKPISFQISLRGSFPNLMRFLAYLENIPYLAKAELIQIQRAGSEISGEELIAGDIITNLHIKTYLAVP